MTVRTKAQLLALYADNVTGDIEAVDLRDFVDTMLQGTAKGALIVFTASGEIVALPAGVNGTMPMADSAPTAGLKYTNPALIAWVLG